MKVQANHKCWPGHGWAKTNTKCHVYSQQWNTLLGHRIWAQILPYIRVREGFTSLTKRLQYRENLKIFSQGYINLPHRNNDQGPMTIATSWFFYLSVVKNSKIYILEHIYYILCIHNIYISVYTFVY